MKNILFRCDASKEIGLGHITRCLVLANQFRDDGHRVYFAIKNYQITIEKLKEQKFDMLIADKEFDYFDWIEEILKEKEIDVFIGDIRDGFPIELISYMKNKNILTVAIDEPSPYAKECDLCFYPPHANINKLEYKGKVFQGLEYVILRDEFYKSFKKKKNDIPNILVMMGGTDAYNLTLPVVKKIDECKEVFEISVILSRKHEDTDLLNQFTKISNHKIITYDKIENMGSFLNDIDFAISQFGTIVYELIVKRVPAKVLALEEINIDLIKFFSKYSIDICRTLNFELPLIFKTSIFKNKIRKKSYISLIIKEGKYEK